MPAVSASAVLNIFKGAFRFTTWILLVILKYHSPQKEKVIEGMPNTFKCLTCLLCFLHNDFMYQKAPSIRISIRHAKVET